MKSKLYHYSDKPLTAIYSRPQTRKSHKPNGLWVSVGAAWKEWCASEMPQWVSPHKAEIKLTKDHRVLLIQTPEELDAFTERYGAKLYSPPLDVFSVDWPQVAEHHAGIIIAPYQYERRFAAHCSWYYTWDCASGCIWDVSAIAEFTAVIRKEKSDGVQNRQRNTNT